MLLSNRRTLCPCKCGFGSRVCSDWEVLVGPYAQQYQVHQELNHICSEHDCSWVWAKQITFLTRQYLLAGFPCQKKRWRCYQPHPQYSVAFWAIVQLCSVVVQAELGHPSSTAWCCRKGGWGQHQAMVMSSLLAWLLCHHAFPPCRRWPASWGSVYSAPVVCFTLPLCSLTAKRKIKHLMLLLCLEKYRN